LGFGLYFDRSVGLYFDGVGVLVLVSMQNQVVWGLIAEFLCRLLWWVRSSNHFFDLVFSCIFILFYFFVLGGERHKMKVKI